MRVCGQHASYHQDPLTGACFPFHVSRVPGVGRVLVAAADLLPGEQVFRERELVVGPSRTTPPVCLGCGRRVSGKVRCPGCSWPLCSAACTSTTSLHTAKECAAIAPTGPSIPDVASPGGPACPAYQAIAALRVASLPTEELDYLLEFMDHSEERDTTDLEENVVARVREEWGQAHIPAELLRRIEGILDVNGVEHGVKDAPSSQCFLPITALASHSCTR